MMRLRSYVQFEISLTQRRASAILLVARNSFAGRWTHIDFALRRLNCQIPDAYQVVSGGCESEVPFHLEGVPVPTLPQQRDGLEPAEAFFNAFSLPLTDSISDVLGRTSINGTPPGPLQVLGHVRRDL